MGLHPRPRYMLEHRALAMYVHPTFFDLATPLVPKSLVAIEAISGTSGHRSNTPMIAFDRQGMTSY